MPKQKTHKGAAKRCSVTKNGLVKHQKAFKGHILTKKSTKRKRNLRQTGYTTATEGNTIKHLIPYK